MAKNNILSTIIAVGGVLLALPVIFATLGVEADLTVYAGIVGGTIALVVAISQASRLFISFEKKRNGDELSGKVSLNTEKPKK